MFVFPNYGSRLLAIHGQHEDKIGKVGGGEVERNAGN